MFLFTTIRMYLQSNKIIVYETCKIKGFLGNFHGSTQNNQSKPATTLLFYNNLRNISKMYIRKNTKQSARGTAKEKGLFRV